jgi:hypothetical protein
MLAWSKACSTSKTQPKYFHFFAALLTTHFVTVNRNIWYDCDESVSQMQTDATERRFSKGLSTGAVIFDAGNGEECVVETRTTFSATTAFLRHLCWSAP